MKYAMPALLALGLLISTSAARAADVLGTWRGGVQVMGTTIPLVVHVDGTPDSLVVSLDSPNQGAFGLSCSQATFVDQVLRFEVPVASASYAGTMDVEGTRIDGTWTQGGADYTLNLTSAVDAAQQNRPQLPKPPFPYRREVVTIITPTDGVSLAGTLTVPEGSGPFPGVVLVSGSGAQDRDESIFGHKPFLVLADHLTRLGIAVLRYDDRGIGESTGDFSTATSRDFAVDAQAALEFLVAREEVADDQVGMLGHSEGGLIGPMVAQASDQLAFLILLAGPAVSGYEILVEQTAAIAKVGGLSQEMTDEVVAINKKIYDAALNANSPEEIEPAVAQAIAEERQRVGPEVADALGASEDSAPRHARTVSNPWFLEFLRYDPRAALAALDVPVLAVFGGKDLQVLPTQNAPVLAEVQPKAEIVILENHNHLFQIATTGAMSEYGTIEETMSPKALETLSNWILKQVQ